MNKQKLTQPSESKNLPKIEDVLTALTRPGTIYHYPDRPIIFPDSKQSPVKNLDVNICVTQDKNESIFHKLNTTTKQKQGSDHEHT